LSDNAAWYWTHYFLERNNFLNPLLNKNKTWSVEVFDDVDVLIEKATSDSKMVYCFGINFKTFDVVNNDFDVEFMFGKQDLPDTNLAAYSPLYKNPDLQSWGKWFSTGAPQLYPYITEFIARAKANTAESWNSTTPFLLMNVAYAPMMTAKYQDIDAKVS